MNVDVEGASRIALLATRFDWTWSSDDIARLCAAAGWEPTPLEGRIVEVRTDIRVLRPEASIYLKNGEIDYFSIFVTDVIVGNDMPWVEVRRNVGDGFVDMAKGLTGVLGTPDSVVQGIDSEMRWNRSNVVVKLFASVRSVVLDLYSPRYIQFMDNARDGEEG